jgi:hypothetical protein
MSVAYTVLDSWSLAVLRIMSTAGIRIFIIGFSDK